MTAPICVMQRSTAEGQVFRRAGSPGLFLTFCWNSSVDVIENGPQGELRHGIRCWMTQAGQHGSIHRVKF
ncbi:hypothetical protein VTK73DRAFT_4008 [Phialemonium thermophilum]|uniref:Uncharacterized protein n=1 Tax=Phialemonium thermophilum TaxID=223376 RepID=A0ABR3VCY1_9PEZI